MADITVEVIMEEAITGAAIMAARRTMADGVTTVAGGITITMVTGGTTGRIRFIGFSRIRIPTMAPFRTGAGFRWGRRTFTSSPDGKR